MLEFSRLPRRRALLTATLCASFLVAPQAQSFERVVIGARHYFHCLGLMLSDPRAHEAECLPNNMVLTQSLTTGSSPTPVATPPAPPPVVIVTPPPPPPPAPDPCACGSCYAA